MIMDETNGKAPETVAKLVKKVIKKKNPAAKYTVCFEYKLIVALTRFLPNSLVEKIFESIYMSKPLPKDSIWSFDKCE